MEIKRVLVRKDGVKMVIIPKASDIKAGELVLISNSLNLINKFQVEEKNARRQKRKK